MQLFTHTFMQCHLFVDMIIPDSLYTHVNTFTAVALELHSTLFNTVFVTELPFSLNKRNST